MKEGGNKPDIDNSIPIRIKASANVEIRDASNFIEKSKMAEILEITDAAENEYLITTMAWNLNRKRGQELDRYSRSVFMDAIEKTGGVGTFLSKTIDSWIRSKEETSVVLLNKKNQIVQENPSVGLIANVLDRVSNALSIYITQAKEEERLPKSKIIEGSKEIIERYCTEISEARIQNRTNL